MKIIPIIYIFIFLKEVLDDRFSKRIDHINGRQSARVSLRVDAIPNTILTEISIK